MTFGLSDKSVTAKLRVLNRYLVKLKVKLGNQCRHSQIGLRPNKPKEILCKLIIQRWFKTFNSRQKEERDEKLT